MESLYSTMVGSFEVIAERAPTSRRKYRRGRRLTEHKRCCRWLLKHWMSCLSCGTLMIVWSFVINDIESSIVSLRMPSSLGYRLRSINVDCAELVPFLKSTRMMIVGFRNELRVIVSRLSRWNWPEKTGFGCGLTSKNYSMEARLRLRSISPPEKKDRGQTCREFESRGARQSCQEPLSGNNES